MGCVQRNQAPVALANAVAVDRLQTAASCDAVGYPARDRGARIPAAGPPPD